MNEIRLAISEGSFADFCESTRREWEQGDIAPR
jgi:hypothetical protein